MVNSRNTSDVSSSRQVRRHPRTGWSERVPTRTGSQQVERAATHSGPDAIACRSAARVCENTGCEQALSVRPSEAIPGSGLAGRGEPPATGLRNVNPGSTDRQGGSAVTRSDSPWPAVRVPSTARSAGRGRPLERGKRHRRVPSGRAEHRTRFFARRPAAYPDRYPTYRPGRPSKRLTLDLEVEARDRAGDVSGRTDVASRVRLATAEQA
jgi:hypothetical protein